MSILIKNILLLRQGNLVKGEVFFKNDTIEKIGTDLDVKADTVIDGKGCALLRGLADVHVHFRDPGLTHKETIKTGSMAAAHGGFVKVMEMSNVKPYPDNLNTIKDYLAYVEKESVIESYPYSCLTLKQQGEELVDLETIASNHLVKAYTDDGGLGLDCHHDNLVRKAMQLSHDLNLLLAFHCENRDLEAEKRIMFEGERSKQLNILGGMSDEAEADQVEYFVRLAKEYRAHIHICHVSCRQSVDILRKARQEGVDVTGEATCHHLTLTDMDVLDGNFKMSPPLKNEDDKTALIEAIKDGTITIIASDHAPHAKEEKENGIENAAFGIVSLETSFPVLYTELVRTNLLSLDELLTLMSNNPIKRFKLGEELTVEEGKKASFFLADLENEYTIHKEDFLSKGKNTPYDKKKVYGRIKLCVDLGRIVYKEEDL